MATATAKEHVQRVHRTPIVYLAGPVTGSPASDDSWRLQVARKLKGKATVTDPCAHPVIRKRLAELDIRLRDHEFERQFGQDIVDRDREGVKNADIVLANFEDARTISIGSIGELFWADAFGKDILIVRDFDKSPYDHAMVNAIATRVFGDVESALDYIAINY